MPAKKAKVQSPMDQPCGCDDPAVNEAEGRGADASYEMPGLADERGEVEV